MTQYVSTFPVDRLATTIESLRAFDFIARAHMVTDVVAPELVASLAANAPAGEKYTYPSTTPEKTERLRQSFYPVTATQRKNVQLFIRSRAKYARFVLKGTPPHEIVAKRPEGFLVFYWKLKNGWHFPRVVQHPGTKANDYAAPARLLMRDRAPATMALVMRDFPH